MRVNTRWMRVAVSSVAGILALTSMTACSATPTAGGSGSATQAKEIRIGALYLDSQGYYGGVKKGVQDAAKASGLNVKLIESSSAGDVAKESSFMQSLVSSGVSAIIISAVSADGSIAAVKAASEAGIPVICYNTCVSADAMSKYVTAYILGDPLEFGKLAGDFAADFYKKKGNEAPQFGVLNCEQYEVCQQRMKGFKDALMAKLPNAKIASDQEGTEADKAISVGEQIITANPGITGMYGQSGGATVGAFKSVGNRSKTGTIFAFGSDMTTDIATALKDGTVLQAVVDISGLEVGKMAFAQAKDAMDGKKPAQQVIAAPVKLYTPDMAQAWIDAHPDGLP
jgi:ABC-type sugar transport system substrate-binding protein